MYDLKDMVIGLASKSPRRKFLLEESGFNVKLIDSPGEEVYPQHLGLKEIPEYLSMQKALNALPYGNGIAVILAADTVVIQDNQLLGKPKNQKDCKATLKKLAGRSHQVLTGVSILFPPFKKVFTVQSTVSIGTLDDSELDFYIEQYAPFDKAGSYGIQEWLGYCKVQRIEGSYTNVMGLPMYEVYHAMQEMIKTSKDVAGEL